ARGAAGLRRTRPPLERADRDQRRRDTRRRHRLRRAEPPLERGARRHRQQRQSACRQPEGRPVSISDIFIKRPVLSTVLGLLIMLLGLQGLAGLQTREYPEVEETGITVTTPYPGASADLIQGFITSPIAKAVATTENVDYISTQSRPSVSVVTVNMELGSDPDAALTEVMSKVQEVRRELPPDAEDPSIVKGTGMQFATMYLAVQNPNMTPEQ